MKSIQNKVLAHLQDLLEKKSNRDSAMALVTYLESFSRWSLKRISTIDAKKKKNRIRQLDRQFKTAKCWGDWELARAITKSKRTIQFENPANEALDLIAKTLFTHDIQYPFYWAAAVLSSFNCPDMGFCASENPIEIFNNDKKRRHRIDDTIRKSVKRYERRWASRDPGKKGLMSAIEQPLKERFPKKT